MTRIAPAPAGRVQRAQRQFVPAASTIGASLLALLPIVTTTPLVPDFAFLVFLSWRLLRPDIWSARFALALGFVHDVLSGYPPGQAMALWTIVFLALDVIDTRLGWRDYWMDWLLAAGAILFYVSGGWLMGRLMDSGAAYIVMLPQIGLSILFYPVVARLVVALDRWRLSR